MIIACEKCATTYVLDERLIPAAGAPVQCTRCGHVFTAKLGAAVLQTAPTAETPQARSTMQFGKSGEKPHNQTMMFGGAVDDQTPPPAAANNRTMMFGAGEAAGAKTPPPRSSTLMFGAAGSDAAAKSAPRNATMVFGAVTPESPAAKPAPKNATMMFGAVGADAPKAAPTNATMVFGSAAAAPAAQAPNQTMIFGAVGGPARPNAQTMVFGTAAVPANPPRPAPVPAAAPASSPNRTMMFGIPTAEKPNAEPIAPSSRPAPMMFGQAEGAANPSKLTERTVRIGPEDLERMMREHHALEGRGGEMTPPEGAAPVGASQRTQMFAMSDIRAPEASTPQGGSDAVSSSGPIPEAVQARHDRTAMFAMTPEARPPAQPGPDRSNVRFDPSLMETLPPGGPEPEPLVRSTMIFGAGQAQAARQMIDAPKELPTNPDLFATTMPNLPELPQERLHSPRPLEMPLEATQLAPDDLAQNLVGQVKRRNRLAAGIVVLAVLAATGAVGWKLLGAKLLGKSVPLEAMQGVESGLSELRKDDTASKAAAVKLLLAVVKSHPTFVDAHAGLVTALTLQLDDLQQRAKRLDKAAEERNLRISRYGKEKTPSDWEARAAALAAEVGAIKKDYDPLVAGARELESRLREAYKAMQLAASQAGELSRRAELALIRAQALYHAYGGTDEALKLTNRYQSKADGQSDGWIDLVDAEYAANTRASPELIEAAQKQLTALHERDPTFFRTYVLAARLNLQAKLYDEAEAELQTVSALKPQHDIANELAEWVKKVKAEKAAKEKGSAQ